MLVGEDAEHCEESDDVAAMTISHDAVPVPMSDSERVSRSQSLSRCLGTDRLASSPHQCGVDVLLPVDDAVAQQELRKSGQIRRCGRELCRRPQEYRSGRVP